MPIQTTVIAVHSITKRSGVPRIIQHLVCYLRELDHKVYIVSAKADRKSIRQFGAISVLALRLPFIRGYYQRLFFSIQTQLLVRLLKADLVIGHGDILNQDIVYMHNCVHLAHEKIFGKKLSQLNAVGRIHSSILQQQKFSLLVCNSKFMRNDFASRFHIPLNKMQILYPTIDVDRFSYQKKELLRVSSRRNLKILDNEILIGLITSGDFSKRNVRLFVDVIYQLRQKNNLIRGLIVGKNEDQSYLKQVQMLALGETILFADPIDDVVSYYSALDIFVLPAHIEEFGLSVVEAMACGIPVIISAMVGAGEIASTVQDNAVVSENTTQAYTKSLLPFIKSKKMRLQTGKKNCSIVDAYDNKSLSQLFSTYLANKHAS